jgi:hypothetical protein
MKMSASKKAVVVIDDDGNVFTTSAAFVSQLLRGLMNKPDFILMSRMPDKVASDRFKKSEVWVPPGYEKPLTSGDAPTQTNDAFSSLVKKDKELRQEFKDKAVW